jgi:hypothetical protein
LWVSDPTENANYRLLVRDNATGAINVLGDIKGNVGGISAAQWVNVPVDAIFLTGGENFDILCQTYNSAASTSFTFPWTYTGTSQQDNDPGAGFWNNSNQQTTFRINDLDENGVSRGTELASVTPGSVIRAQVNGGSAYWEYSVGDNTDLGGWHLFSVTLIDSVGGGPAPLDLCDITFTVPTPAPTKYVQITGGTTSGPLIQGVLGFDDVDSTAVNDNDYGVDIYFQEYTASEDWDIKAYSGGSTSAAQSTTYLAESSQYIQHEAFAARFTDTERENIAKAMNKTAWQPGPPPSWLDVMRVTRLVNYAANPTVDVQNPYLIEEINWLQDIGVIGPNRAAQILST